METSEIKLVLKHNDGTPFEDDKFIPTHGTATAAGYDVRALIENENGYISIGPNETYTIQTGVYFELPTDMACLVLPRSGISLKTGLRVANAPGLIDSDYRGEIKVIMNNISQDKNEIINNGDKIAQLVFIKPNFVTFTRADKLSETERGEGGFGSTGVK